MIKESLNIGMFTGMVNKMRPSFLSMRNKAMGMLPSSGKGKLLGTGLGMAAGAAPGAISYMNANKEVDPEKREQKKKNALTMIGVGGTLGAGAGFSATKSLYKKNPILNSRKFVAEPIPQAKPSIFKNPFKKVTKPLDTNPNITQTVWKIKAPMKINNPGIQKFSSWKAKNIGSLSSKYSRTGALVGGGLLALPHLKDYIIGSGSSDPQKEKEFKRKALKKSLGYGIGGAALGSLVGEGVGFSKSPINWTIEHGKNLGGFR